MTAPIAPPSVSPAAAVLVGRIARQHSDRAIAAGKPLDCDALVAEVRRALAGYPETTLQTLIAYAGDMLRADAVALLREADALERQGAIADARHP